ncbi:MAG: ASCH domain-containing protein [Clostridia bacterium]|nr:ASCH domain-containing protein [Clostridia bacterium]
MNDQELWAFFLERTGTETAAYEAWSFGDSPRVADELLALVLAGKKTATASSYEIYIRENTPLPQVGSSSVILNGRGEAECVIKTTALYIAPFAEVSADHAFKEGEGDRSLAHWREVHQDFFTRELSPYNVLFSEDMLVVCEEFELVFVPPALMPGQKAR